MLLRMRLTTFGSALIIILCCGLVCATPVPHQKPIPRELHLSEWGKYVHVDIVEDLQKQIDELSKRISDLGYVVMSLQDHLVDEKLKSK